MILTHPLCDFAADSRAVVVRRRYRSLYEALPMRTAVLLLMFSLLADTASAADSARSGSGSTSHIAGLSGDVGLDRPIAAGIAVLLGIALAVVRGKSHEGTE